jgi:hypothetical protein
VEEEEVEEEEEEEDEGGFSEGHYVYYITTREKRKFSSLRTSRVYRVILLAEAGWRRSRTMGRKKIM